MSGGEEKYFASGKRGWGCKSRCVNFEEPAHQGEQGGQTFMNQRGKGENAYYVLKKEA